VVGGPTEMGQSAGRGGYI